MTTLVLINVLSLMTSWASLRNKDWEYSYLPFHQNPETCHLRGALPAGHLSRTKTTLPPLHPSLCVRCEADHLPSSPSELPLEIITMSRLTAKRRQSLETSDLGLRSQLRASAALLRETECSVVGLLDCWLYVDRQTVVGMST